MAAHGATQEGLEVGKRSRQGGKASARVSLAPLHQRHCPGLPWLVGPRRAEDWSARRKVSQREVQKLARIHVGLVWVFTLSSRDSIARPAYIYLRKRTNVIIVFHRQSSNLPPRKPLEGTSPLYLRDRSTEYCEYGQDMVLLWRLWFTDGIEQVMAVPWDSSRYMPSSTHRLLHDPRGYFAGIPSDCY